MNRQVRGHAHVRPVSIRRYLMLMRRQGVAPEAVLAGTDISERRLLEDDCVLELWQSELVVRNLLRLTKDRSLGFTFGQAVQFHQLGIVGHAMMASGSVRQLVKYWLEYSPVLLGVLTRMQLDEMPDGRWNYRIFSQTADADVYRFSVEESLAFGTQLWRSWSGRPLVYDEARFAYPKPCSRTVDLYQETFRTTLHFDCEQTELRISSPRMSEILSTADVEFSDVCSTQCSRSLARLKATSSVKVDVRNVLRLSVDRVPDIDEVARELGMSARTLRRRLLEENSSYRELLREVQLKRAMEFLKANRMSVKEVGHSLGFRHPNDFMRAFKSWTGHSVKSFLHSHDAVQRSME